MMRGHTQSANAAYAVLLVLMGAMPAYAGDGAAIYEGKPQPGDYPRSQELPRNGGRPHGALYTDGRPRRGSTRIHGKTVSRIRSSHLIGNRSPDNSKWSPHGVCVILVSVKIRELEHGRARK